MAFYSRKSARLPDFDYSSCNYYFITICTHNRKCLFGLPHRRTGIGKITEQDLAGIPFHYTGVRLERYVVMPNHVHMILALENENGNANVSQIVAQFKSGVSRKIRNRYPDMQVWQRSFHDHVIRNRESYEKIWNYIEGNPQNWEKDCFYTDAPFDSAQKNRI